jgi:hypothetical protein
MSPLRGGGIWDKLGTTIHDFGETHLYLSDDVIRMNESLVGKKISYNFTSNTENNTFWFIILKPFEKIPIGNTVFSTQIELPKPAVVYGKYMAHARPYIQTELTWDETDKKLRIKEFGEIKIKDVGEIKIKDVGEIKIITRGGKTNNRIITKKKRRKRRKSLRRHR